MDAFLTHQKITNHYQNYLQSFIHIKDGRIQQHVEEELTDGKFLPEHCCNSTLLLPQASNCIVLMGFTKTFPKYLIITHFIVTKLKHSKKE